MHAKKYLMAANPSGRLLMKTQVTGVVADLLRNKRSIPYARAWRSDLNMLNITQLMVRLWVAEESRLGVSRPNGVLQNLWEPLQSHDRGCGRRSSERTPARRVRSASRGEALGTCASTTSGAGSFAAEVRSSTTPASVDRGSSAHAAALDFEAQSTPSDKLNHAHLPVPSTSEAREASGPRADSGDGANAGHEADRGVSFAVALALEAGKRAVSGQGGVGGGGQRKRASQVGVEASVAKAMASLDLRGKVAAVLGMVGFDGSTTDGLGPTDLKASYMATSYLDFREGGAWQEVNCNCIPAPRLLTAQERKATLKQNEGPPYQTTEGRGLKQRRQNIGCCPAFGFLRPLP